MHLCWLLSLKQGNSNAHLNAVLNQCLFVFLISVNLRYSTTSKITKAFILVIQIKQRIFSKILKSFSTIDDFGMISLQS